MSEAGRRELPLEVLRYRDFRWLWAGQFISTLGTQMHAVALSWQVYKLTGSVVQLGLLGLVRAIALMSASLVGGAVADQYNRRTLMLWTQTVLLLLSAGVAVLTGLDRVNVGVLYVVAMAVAATSAFDAPARQALIPALVPRERLAAAMSLNILAMSIARMAGPAAGGVALAAIGISGTYGIDAVSFFAVIMALIVMRTQVEAPIITNRGIAAVAEGLRFMRATPVILGVMLIDFLATLLGSSVGLAPVFAEDVLKVGPQGLGLLLAAPAAGAVVGGFLMSIVRMPRRPGNVVVVSVVAYGICLALFGISPGIWMALAALAGAGAADAVSVAMRHTVRTLATPDDLRGRVAASHSALATGGPRLGEFQSGMMAALLGPRPAMVVGGLACAVVSVAVSRAIPAVSRYELSGGSPVPRSAIAQKAHPSDVASVMDAPPAKSSAD